MTRVLVSCFLRVMKFGILIVSLLFLYHPQARSLPGSVSGIITVQQGQYSFVDPRTKKRMPLRSLRQETSERLKKLKNQDYFQGQGEVVNNELLLQSIDFVGLRRLLGPWASSSSSIMDFEDYSKVQVYNSFFNIMTPRAVLQYSIVPTATDEWRVFFTDENSVLVASLALKDSTATLKFFDLNSGEVTRTLQLSRLP